MNTRVVTFYQKPKNISWFGLLLLHTLSLLLFSSRAQGQCAPDNLAPVILCPRDTVAFAPIGTCELPILLAGETVFDNCPGAVTITHNAPLNWIFPLDSTYVTYTATDLAGNSATCRTLVKIKGGVPQGPVCNADLFFPEIPVGGLQLTPLDVLEGGPYNCATLGISLLGNPPESVLIINTPGSYQVTCSVTTPEPVTNTCWATINVGNGTNCLPDVTPPYAICDADVTIQTNQSGPMTAVLRTIDLDEGSYDNCSPVTLRLTTDLNASTPPTASSISLTGINDFIVALWVGDDAGNWNQCLVDVTTIEPKCSPDQVPPTCIPPPNMTLSVSEYAALNLNVEDSLAMDAAFGVPFTWDNCMNDTSIRISAYALTTQPNGSLYRIDRSFLIYDGFNSTNCAQTIIIQDGLSTVHIPAWSYPLQVDRDTLSITNTGSDLIIGSFFDVVLNACSGAIVRIDRTYNIANFNDFDPSANPVVLPIMDLNGDGQIGDAYDLVFQFDSVYFFYNNQQFQAPIPTSLGGYTYMQTIRFNWEDTITNPMHIIEGRVFLDANTDCSLDSNESGLAGWYVQATGKVTGQYYNTITDSLGNYVLGICPSDTAVDLSLDATYNYGQNCPTVYPLSLTWWVNTVQNIPVQLDTACKTLTVSLGTNRIRPCFPGHYNVQYCNISNQLALDVYVNVQLDSFLSFTGANIPPFPMGGNTYRFQLDTLDAGECGTIVLTFLPDCNMPVGLTHCSKANIYPDTLCPNNPFWSGAILEANAQCDGDSVRLSIQNIGSVRMADALDFVIVEDLIMFMTAPFQLDPSQEIAIKTPANGATWRIEAPQESNHPWGGIVSAFEEGCGGVNYSGVALTYPVNGDANPFEETDCIVSVSSFDPNDKQAIPGGYGPEHFITKNTALDYTIRFQNTGTDTAYLVKILDTLSSHVDWRSIEPGAASHPYRFDIFQGNIVQFTFDQINLPDSNTNLMASEGFVKYRINQKPNNLDGTQINNRAAIYFDFNAPILTNTTKHRIGQHFITVSTDQQPNNPNTLKAYPNPASEQVVFELPKHSQQGRFVLMDVYGKVVREQQFSGTTHRFERLQLPDGVYLFKIDTAESGIFTGKIMLMSK